MKFRLTATDMANTGNDAEDLKKYLEMIDKAGEEGPAYIIENGFVYINIFYGSDMAKLAEILREELIVTFRNGKATDIEIYNGWRE
jgi:hypothetical protein